MKKKYFIFLLSISLFACRSKNIVTMSVIEPAPVTMPASIKTIGVINRSIATDESKKMDEADKILSLEGKNLDKEGAEKCVKALLYELQKNTRFTQVKFLDNVFLKNSGLGVLPAPLSWDAVEKICTENKIDCLYSLELYDTDSKVNYSVVPVTLKGPLGVDIPAVEHVASITTHIKVGWRIYDAINKNILDEFPGSASITSAGRGINPMVALQAVMGRKEAVLDKSNSMGESYGQSILPYQTRVSRDYYVRGTDNFKIARRKAQTGNWNEAGELWKKETTNSKRKVAGRAHYNMAIISEINGDLDGAIQWAQKAYENYKNKLALRYVNILKYRKSQNRLLNQQQEAQ